MIQLLLLLSVVLQSTIYQFTQEQGAQLLSYTPLSSKIIVQFSEPPEIAIGTPVVMHGVMLGKVRAIIEGEQSATQVKIALLEGQQEKVAEGTIALRSSAWSASRGQTLTFIELLNPEGVSLSPEGMSGALQNERIKGFLSYEAFWRAPKEPFSL